MGTVYTEITIRNFVDIIRAENGLIKEDEIRQVTVQAVVDTGASTLFITEETRQKLGLTTKSERFATLGDNTLAACQRAEPVEIWWQNRSTTCHPIVFPNSEETLLGVIPLEDMDLVVDPVRQTLAGAHGDEVVYMARRNREQF